MSKIQITVFLLCATICIAAEISVPLTKRSIQNGSNYEEESFYTFDLSLEQGKSFLVHSVIDVQADQSWVVDKSCSNCFSAPSDHDFTCTAPCGATVTDSPAIKIIGSKVRVSKHVPVSSAAIIDDVEFKIDNLLDVTELKNSAQIKELQLYLNQVQGGIALGAETAKDPKGIINSISKETNKLAKKQFSLFFNGDSGRLLIGERDDFYGTEGTTFNALPDQDDGKTLSWAVKVGPNFKIADAPLLSTQIEDVPSSNIEDLHAALLDSTTKYIKVPLAPWQRLDKTLFQHNNCSVDENLNSLCDCEGTWKEIELQLVKDPKAALENNIQQVQLKPSDYLQEISSGKCLLLIKPQESDASTDYVLGTSFLKNFYSVYDLDKKTLVLAKATQIEEQSKALDNNYRIPIVVVGSVLGLLSVGGLLAILKKVQAPTEKEIYQSSQQEKVKHQQNPVNQHNQAPQNLNLPQGQSLNQFQNLPLNQVHPHAPTPINYIIRSPNHIDTLPQTIRVPGSIGSPIRARVINSPVKNSQYVPQLYYQY